MAPLRSKAVPINNIILLLLIVNVVIVVVAAAAASDDVDAESVMEQNIGQDEQANKFSAELRIRKTQVFNCYYFTSISFAFNSSVL